MLIGINLERCKESILLCQYSRRYNAMQQQQLDVQHRLGAGSCVGGNSRVPLWLKHEHFRFVTRQIL